jgi:Glyoxalase-like domain
VPLGNTYLELIAAVDEAEAAQSPVGRWVADSRPGRPLGWCVHADRLEDVARRLELTVAPVSRAAPDGRLFRGRIAGIEQAAAEPSLPFFIERGEGSPFPGGARATHRAGPVEITRLELSGDADRLADWLGPHDLPITIRAGLPAVASIVLTGSAGEIVVAEI